MTAFLVLLFNEYVHDDDQHTVPVAVNSIHQTIITGVSSVKLCQFQKIKFALSSGLHF